MKIRDICLVRETSLY